ncbi:MAG: 50S ribosomal protein L32 [Candidatus Gracilibacteria bacterium]|nr:50S ribosomal protein L32 [Candidatus Gracilibacteria bacterium]
MTFAPKKKVSKTRTKRRTTNWIKLSAKKLLNRVQLQYNEAGEAVGLAHFAKLDGTYKDRQVFKVKTKKKSVTRI